MISHKHKCVFVHIPKAAGKSIEQMFLNDLSWSKDKARVPFLLLINPSKENGPPRLAHLTAKQYTEFNYISDETFQEYYTFGWVRNPYGRIYSFYKYFCYNYLISFEKFVLIYLKENFHNDKLNYFYRPMYDFLYIDGERAVDYVGKLESINDDVQNVIDSLGMTAKSLPHENKSNNIRFKLKLRRLFDIIKSHPSIIFNYTFSKSKKGKKYSSDMKKVMKELYAKDFESFNYDF